MSENDKVFDLCLVFTGICSLVTEKPLKDEPKQLYLVLADGWAEKRDTGFSGLDDYENLMRHAAMVQFPLRNVSATTSVPASGKGIWYLKRQRLDFGFDEQTPNGNPFNIEPTLVDHVADMTKLAPGHAAVGPDALGLQPPQGILANSSRIDKGTLKVDNTMVVGQWRFAPTLATKSILIPGLGYRIVLELKALKKFTLTASPFNGAVQPRPGNPGSGLAEKLEIVAMQDGEKIEVTVGNLCDENPLIWPMDSTIELRKKDLDFKWHYEILPRATKDALIRSLDGKELPYPIYAGNDLGSGRNCFPAFFTT